MFELDAARLADGLVWYLVFVFSTTCHEAAHAFAAHRLGDSTAYHAGQVSLSPWPHIRREPFGMVLVPILSFLYGGWMIGWASAPYDPRWALRYPKKSALMALAGPLANFVIVVLAGVLLRVGLGAELFVPSFQPSLAHLVSGPGAGWVDGLATALSVAFALNLLLGVFNLMPFPPLDGSSVVQLLMGENLARRYQGLLYEVPMLAWAGLLLAWRFFDVVFSPVLGFALQLLFAGAG